MSPATAPAFDTSQQHNPVLDGVRGIAVLAVLAFHVRGPIPDLAGIAWLRYPLHLLSPLWSGVDLFFVLSGFLITNILLRARRHPHYFRNFYARRTLRIFPLYYFTLLLHYLAELWGPEALSGPGASRLRLWYWLYAQNWLGGLYGESLRAFEHYWSLAIEEQFYLLWPLVVLATRSNRAGLRICGSCLVLCLGLRCGLLGTENGSISDCLRRASRLDRARLE